MQKTGAEMVASAAKSVSKRQYVEGGPMLWVSTTLHHRGALSANRIWEEYVRDDSTEKDLIKSKSFLKRKLLPQMYKAGKVERARAGDMPEYKLAGWRVVPTKAFRNTAPRLLLEMDPVPELGREDLKAYVEKQYAYYQNKV